MKNHGVMGREERERWGLKKATARIQKRCKL